MDVTRVDRGAHDRGTRLTRLTRPKIVMRASLAAIRAVAPISAFWTSRGRAREERDHDPRNRGYNVYGDRAAIAVMGPGRSDGPKAGRTGEVASALGHHLARAGYAVVVEGHGLVAQAVARAARQADTPVVAVETRNPGPTGPSDHTWGAGIAVEQAVGTFGAIDRVLALADAAILLAGDLRALTLLTQIWSWGLEPDAPYRQVILVGDGWPEAVRTLADAVGLDPKTRAMVTFAKEPGEAVEALRYYIAPR